MNMANLGDTRPTRPYTTRRDAIAAGSLRRYGYGFSLSLQDHNRAGVINRV
jgi:hypothetical protein